MLYTTLPAAMQLPSGSAPWSIECAPRSRLEAYSMLSLKEAVMFVLSHIVWVVRWVSEQFRLLWLPSTDVISTNYSGTETKSIPGQTRGS